MSAWAEAPAFLTLKGNDIHVWTASLKIEPAQLAQLSALLAPAESERAKSFKFDIHRHRFIAGRAQLRMILGRYLSIDPSILEFNYSPEGKPSLRDGNGLYFNLAHSEDLALAAVTRLGPIGIDVEFIRLVPNMAYLVAQFFSTHESQLFETLPLGDRPGAFFSLWTRKEALLKAIGEGIARSLNLVEVSFLPDESPRVIAISEDPVMAAKWSLHAFSPVLGTVAALAVEGQVGALSLWKTPHLLPRQNLEQEIMAK